MKIVMVVGARPNFMKVAPVIRAVKDHNARAAGQPITTCLVHTGQHYDYEMSQVFFQNLDLPAPDVYLGIGSGSHAEQTGRVMIEFEKVLVDQQPDVVLVVGDVNSTLAAAIAAVKLHIKLAHVEAGLRAFDRDMPEEINRLLTDAVSDYLFTTSPSDDANLRHEGIPEEKIFRVGNTMIDSLFYSREKAAGSTVLDDLGLQPGGYGLVTLHRPDNVDNREHLAAIAAALKEIAAETGLVFPVHPRTRKSLETFGMADVFDGTAVTLLPPAGYLDFIRLESSARFVITDSGGIEPETTALGIPCFTLLELTCWPDTIEKGTNTVVGHDMAKLVREVRRGLAGEWKQGSLPDYWDGHAAERIVAILGR